jgi:hypothetical protein
VCHYPERLEQTVKLLVDRKVWAHGTGHLQSPLRGTLELEQIHPIGEYEQSALFTFDHLSVPELMAQQGIAGPQEHVSIIPETVSDEEAERFLEALLDE